MTTGDKRNFYLVQFKTGKTQWDNKNEVGNFQILKTILNLRNKRMDV